MRIDTNHPRVVHIINTPMMLGFFSGQIGFFRAQGFLLDIVSSPGDGLFEFGRDEGIPVHEVRMTRTITPLRDLITLYRLWRLFRRLRPTVVDGHTPKGGVIGMTAAWLARVPVRIYHVHSLPLLEARGIKRVILRWCDRVAGRLAHRVVCVSHSIRRAALAERLFPAVKTKVLARGTINGLESTTRFNPAVLDCEAGRRMRVALGIPVEVQVLGFIGRVNSSKGVVELADAWRDLRARYPDMHLMVVGPFESKDAIPPRVKEELDADPRAHLVVGWVKDPRPYYVALDVLTLPSHREGFPYALLEAAAMGLPVVATAVPGCVDAVVDGVTGTLIPPRDATALARAVAAYLDDPSLRREHGRAGRERIVREFGQREVWDALLAEYLQLITARPPHDPTR